MTTLRRPRSRIALAGLGIVAVLATQACGTAESESAPGDAERSHALTRALDDVVRKGFPGVQVVSDGPDGHRTVSAGVGDLATGAPFPENAQVRIGSNTKTFVATVLLQLAAEGTLDLDAPIERYLPGVVRGNGNDGNRVTVRQLMQHTSGLPDYVGAGNPEAMTAPNPVLVNALSDEARWRQYAPAELVRIAMSQPPQFEPGTRQVYTNTNYILLGQLVEQLTGRPAAEAVRTRILEPLGLRDTYTPAAGETVIRGPHPVGYQTIDGKRADFTDLNPAWASTAGDMVATGSDVNRFFTALLDGKLLPAAQLEQMRKTVPFDRMPGSGYGLGLIDQPVSCGKRVWGHGGSIPGYETRNGVASDGRAVTVIVNQLPDSAETDKVVAAVLDAALCE
ncbi:serine hydrolase domain-containing protein [Nocardia jejuensis]|uniref:serine hydrolase domain-containing protein n=1 Tax=Nocardia jejuensis TaxID=328049 RepID=UPI00083431BE|nr:serine hydrolase domain-containing protein [Nocardia jejuensis]